MALPATAATTAPTTATTIGDVATTAAVGSVGSVDPAPPTTVQATTTTVNLDALPPIALGESVMKGAEGVLQAAGFAVDAQESRQGTDLVAELAALRAGNRIGRTVVIQIGTNGSVSDATFDAIMAPLPQELTPNVVFLTVRVDENWMDGQQRAHPRAAVALPVGDGSPIGRRSPTRSSCATTAPTSPATASAPIQAYADLIVTGDRASRPARDVRPVRPRAAHAATPLASRSCPVGAARVS